MIEADLEQLVRRDCARLDRLELDIWTRESELLAAHSSSKRITNWQAGILALAVLSSASFGMFRASYLRDEETALLHADLAPASLLLGSRE